MSLTPEEIKEELESISASLQTIRQVTDEISSALFYSQINQLERRGLYSYNDEIKDLLDDQINKIRDITTYHL